MKKMPDHMDDSTSSCVNVNSNIKNGDLCAEPPLYSFAY
jgi:hypothetical protein